MRMTSMAAYSLGYLKDSHASLLVTRMHVRSFHSIIYPSTAAMQQYRKHMASQLPAAAAAIQHMKSPARPSPGLYAIFLEGPLKDKNSCAQCMLYTAMLQHEIYACKTTS